jgi:hypothetical protein
MGASADDISQLHAALKSDNSMASEDILETHIRMMLKKDAETNGP